MITLTTAEARRQFNNATHDQDHYQHWSDWRRAHQATVLRSHYSRRLRHHGLSL